MTLAYVSTVIRADIDAVWSVLGDFHGLAAWVNRIRSNEPENGAGPGAVGSVRNLTLEPDGDTARERLVRYDAADRSYSYEFAGAIPFPASSYRGTVHVLPVTDANTTFLEWYGEFDCEPDVLDEIARTFCAIYSEFISDLRAYLNG
ncbi:SRPBCC family protein [Mycobacterium talmoniae]|uniref:MxaD family protein n=1 Tax=Mycobacterium talmoniae TaxID=1858794 RepID=A0A1S1NR84_9MYCO|nr:SRPBCC family protein [Mycobacterium talmoniae]OHV06967.1 MxaD family protein [Mycobacterium talmoniae]PQM48002.1 hypothetical protein C1Y40_01825 [Mycobacterium talmoniae]